MPSRANEPVQITVVRGEEINFRGAAIVQKNGQELPITEQMIQRALEHMVREWESAYMHATVNPGSPFGPKG